jgi:hypothetical protein
MKTSEILRKLADMIDAKSDEQNQDLAQQPDDIFIPPLQLKLELLKKATGVENVYDDDPENQNESHGYDELEAIKKNAGISVVALDALSDDEPLEN